ncbi:MAG: tetratricopeptide repeat protein, partial [Nitrospirales bacterium]|nr:tetratricopeptide repeat protein [Nitrospirales bacterium]
MKTRIIFFILAISYLTILHADTAFSSADLRSCSPLAEGKKALDQGKNDLAVQLFSSAFDSVPLLGDYALLWRSKAYEKKGQRDHALADLRAIREKYSDSPLVKEARKKEVEIASATGEEPNKETVALFTAYLKDYPSDLKTKCLFASYLKAKGEKEKAKELFREVYRSSSSLSSPALKELAPSDITAKDMVERGETLNKAWLFPESEKCFREAIGSLKKGSDLWKQANEGLAFSLFSQKRYKEAAALYKELNIPYWRARAL